jgi:ribosome-binding factor A
MSGDRRMLRVNELVREHLVEILRREVSDPELGKLVITSVDVSKDLSIAHVLVRHLAATDDEKARQGVLLRLRKAAPRLRRALSTRIDLKKLPELRFDYDRGADAALRVAELLEEIKHDPRGED